MPDAQVRPRVHVRANADRLIEERCPYYLAIGSIFRNEGPFLKEWIEFHKMMGVELFVLVDDGSTDDFLDVLRPYIDAREVALVRRPCSDKRKGRAWQDYQCAMLRALCDRLRGLSRWLALIDVDEFIVPTGTDRLPEFLARHESRGAIYVRWEPFGTSYLKKLPPGRLMTEALHLKHRFVKGHEMLGKSIVKPHRVLHANIHQCTLLPAYEYEDCNPGMQLESPPLRLHHYWSRDEDYLLNEKLPRAARIKGWDLDEERVEFFRHLFNDVPDHSMKRFAPGLRRRVFPPDEGA